MGEVAWSSGQHRRLPLQGSRDRIPVQPILLSKLKFFHLLPVSQTGIKEVNVSKKALKQVEIESAKRRRERRDELDEPAGVSGMDTRNRFGSFRRRLNGECQARNDMV